MGSPGPGGAFGAEEAPMAGGAEAAGVTARAAEPGPLSGCGAH
jgi:hypothetical protein